MRIVFVGTSKISLSTARKLLDAGQEVVFVEMDKGRIDRLSDEMDCGFLEGDGSSPAILEEVGPEQTDFLFCLTGNDKDNIIAGLVGRSLGFPRVVIKVEDFALEHICSELGLEDVIVPTRTISRYLTEMISGESTSELSSAIKGEARFFTFIAGAGDAKPIKDLPMPEKARIVCYYRKKEFQLATDEDALQENDEVVVLCHQQAVEKLTDAWPSQAADQEKGADKLKR